jgi:hypothetical protein
VTSGAAGAAPDDRLPSALRASAELVAWVATPWWLAESSWPLAVAALVLLTGLPTVFATPGDKARVLVPAPGRVTVALVLLQLVAAVVSSWAAWPHWAAVVVSVLVAATVVTEQPRWRRLLRRPRAA